MLYSEVNVPAPSGTAAASPAAGFVRRTGSKTRSCVALAPAGSSRAERGSAAEHPETRSAERRQTPVHHSDSGQSTHLSTHQSYEFKKVLSSFTIPNLRKGDFLKCNYNCLN